MTKKTHQPNVNIFLSTKVNGVYNVLNGKYNQIDKNKMTNNNNERVRIH